eukprot:s986_g13.t1
MHPARRSRPALHVGLLLGVVTGTQLLQSLWCIRSWVPQASHRPRLRPRQAVGTESAVRDVTNDEHWLSFSSSVDIEGASASEAYDIYAHLPNHPEWSSLLSEVEVHDNSQSSTWSLQALGFSFSWTADITRQVPSKLIGWESTSGMKNAGVAKFQELPPSAGTPACRVTVQMSLRTPSLLRRVFQSRRLSSMAESAIGKDHSSGDMDNLLRALLYHMFPEAASQARAAWQRLQHRSSCMYRSVRMHAGMHGWMHGWLAGWLEDGWMDGWMDGCMDAWMHGLDGWMDGWLDGRMNE